MTFDTKTRVLYGSPLNRPRIAKFVLLVLIVLILLSTTSFIYTLTSFEPDVLRVFSLALLWSGLLSIIPLAILWFLDRREQESGWLYLITFMWGAFIATGIAIPINDLILADVEIFLTGHPALQHLLGDNATYTLGAPIAGPIVEETLKGLGVLLLFLLLRAEFDDVRDGFIYGALVGIGFNFLEPAMYVAEGYADSGAAPWIIQLAGRHALLGFGSHALFTGLFGLFLGLSRQTTRRWVRYLAPPLGWGLGFSAHFLNNVLPLIMTLLLGILGGDKLDGAESTPTPDLTIPEPSFLQTWFGGSLRDFILFFPFLVVVLVMLWRSGVWERRVIREQLADEVGSVVTSEEYEVIRRDRIFKTRRIQGSDRRTSTAIVQAQNNLAIRKWRVKKMGGSPKLDPLVASWRGEVLHLRGQPEEMVV